MPSEVDESDIMGYTEPYTDAYPEKGGETNFDRELNDCFAGTDEQIGENNICSTFAGPLN